MLFLLLPMMAGLVLLAEPLVRLLYEWKSWDSFSTEITSRALIFMSLGMVGYGVQNVLSRAFYAEQDGKTPLISGAISIGVNLVLCLLLTDRLDVAGLGLATAVSATVSAIVLLIPTIRRYPQALDKAFWSGVLRMVVAAAVMSGAVYCRVPAALWLAFRRACGQNAGVGHSHGSGNRRVFFDGIGAAAAGDGSCPASPA